MCGIVGYIGKRPALAVIMEGLKRLEYRGYDSSGVAIFSGKKIFHRRAVGRIRDLEARLALGYSDAHMSGTIGIGHTRWATHGEPTETNAHPHADCAERVFVVHNGIIENHEFLKEALEREGHDFHSQTDTEVIAHLIERGFWHKPKITLEEATADAARHLRGTFGIAVISLNDPDKVVIARRGSPLILGVGDNEYIVASDASAIVKHTKHVIYLHDDEIGTCFFQSLCFRNEKWNVTMSTFIVCY